MGHPTLQDWLWVEVMLIQSMVGAISSNFRQVVLSYENNEWHLRVTLEEMIDEDREEISDIVDEFAIMLDGIRDKISDSAYVRVVPNIITQKGSLFFQQKINQRIIYRRKEPLELYK